MQVPLWENLNRFGKSRMLQSSYVWLFVVPITAKALAAVEDPLVLTGISEGLRIHLVLPFSWRCFYFSAAAVSIAGLIYSLLCPELIRRFSTFQEYLAEGRGLEYLKEYAAQMQSQSTTWEEGFNSVFNIAMIEKPGADRGLAAIFWYIHAQENRKSPRWRLACYVLYVVGLSLIALVIAQNFVFVVGSMWHTP